MYWALVSSLSKWMQKEMAVVINWLDKGTNQSRGLRGPWWLWRSCWDPYLRQENMQTWHGLNFIIDCNKIKASYVYLERATSYVGNKANMWTKVLLSSKTKMQLCGLNAKRNTCQRANTLPLWCHLSWKKGGDSIMLWGHKIWSKWIERWMEINTGVILE